MSEIPRANNLKRRTVAVMAAIGVVAPIGALQGCADGNFSPAAKGKLERIIKPEAKAIAALALKHDQPTLSDDGKEYLLSVDGKKDSLGDHVGVFVQIARKGTQPADPNNVTSVSFDHWQPDPHHPGSDRIDASAELDNQDALRNEHAWYAESSSYYREPYTADNLDLYDSSVEYPSDVDSPDAKHAFANARDIVKEVKQDYANELFPR